MWKQMAGFLELNKYKVLLSQYLIGTWLSFSWVWFFKEICNQYLKAAVIKRREWSLQNANGIKIHPFSLYFWKHFPASASLFPGERRPLGGCLLALSPPAVPAPDCVLPLGRATLIIPHSTGSSVASLPWGALFPLILVPELPSQSSIPWPR